MLIFGAVIIAFWPVYTAGFIWDDNVMLTESPLMRGSFFAIWTGVSGVDYFPVTYSSLWLEWHLWGPNPFGYHVTNVVVHALSCVVLWRMFVRLNFATTTALVGALLFALHPVNVESVAWIAERKNVLAMLFYTITAWSFVRFAQSEQRKWYIVSLAAFLLSLLAKPAAVAWPAVALGILWWTGKSRGTLPSAKDVARVVPFALIAMTLGLVTIWCQYHFAIKGDVIYERHFSTRLATASMAVWFYLGKALVPWRLSFVYPLWNLTSLTVTEFLPLIALTAVFAVFWFFRKSWGRPILWAFVYFILLLLPVLGFFKISYQRYSYVADHWQYFSLPAVTLVIAFILTKVARGVLPIVGTILVLLFGWLTFAQARIYHDKETIWEDTLAKNPNCWVALGGLGLERMTSGRLEEGIALCEKSLTLYPHQGESHANIGLALVHLGRVDEGIEHMRQAIQIEPDYAPTHYNLGNALRGQGNLDEAIIQYREAIRLSPDNPLAYNGLGAVYAVQQRREEAAELFRKALAFHSDDVDALSNLGAMLTSLHKPDEGLPLLQKAVALSPNYAMARANLGNTLFDLHRVPEAREQFETALRIDPNLIQAKYGLNDCLNMAGDGK
jgi:tetratricopeptide (TPR) repeat protein